MTNESLLLDSAGMLSSDSNPVKIHAEADSLGDLERWYVLRVSYCRELKLQERLNERGIMTFIPMKSVRDSKKGNPKIKEVPAIHNLVFAYSNRTSLDEYISSEADAQMTHYMWDKATRKPIVVPEKQMNDFIRVCTNSEEDLIYLTDISDKLRSGSKVKVINGPFSGVEGVVVRIKKSRRVMVEIPSILSVASAYIPLEYLEIIN